VAVVQYTFTHKQYTERQKTNTIWNNTNILEECGPCPVFASYSLAFALQLRKKHRKTSVRVAYYHSVQNLLSSSLLPKNVKIFENRVLRRIFGPKRTRKQGSGENYIMRSFMVCTAQQILIG
jgi:hypothetical protein